MAISSSPTKKSMDFFLLKNAVELINSHDIVFLQSYANFQEVNLDEKSREKNTKSMPLGFRLLYKCSHLILTRSLQVFCDSSSKLGAKKC